MEIFIDKSEVKHISPLNSLKSAEKLAKKCPAARLHVVFVFTHVFLESLCKNTLVPDCLSPVKLFYWHHRLCRPTAKPQ